MLNDDIRLMNDNIRLIISEKVEKWCYYIFKFLVRTHPVISFFLTVLCMIALGEEMYTELYSNWLDISAFSSSENKVYVSSPRLAVSKATI